MNNKPRSSNAPDMTLEQALAGLEALRRELDQARLDAARVSQVKDDFLSRISHELRTPLNAIMGMGELLQATGLDQTQATYLSMISESTSQLLRLVNEILDFSDMQDQTTPRSPEEFLFRDAFEPAFVQFRLKAQAKGLHLFVHVDKDIPEFLQGYPRWIFQILSALVDNAVKFTDHGEVLIQFYPSDRKENHFTLCICVTDTGIGVPKDEQQHIFEKFITAHDSQKYGGIGMGLALAEKLVKRMHGRIWVDSQLYLGSTFYVSLPMTSVVPVEEQAEAVISGPFTVLLAEDEPVNRFTTVQLLSKQGHHIDAVNNGRQALEALSRKKYDLVLMDISMPEMDGLEATEAIRSGDVSGVPANIPIIALTALVMPADRKRCLEAGMDAYLPKPVDTKKLEEVMGEVVARKQ